MYGEQLADEMKADIVGWNESNYIQQPPNTAETEVILNPKHDQLMDQCNGKDDKTLTVVSKSKKELPSLIKSPPLPPIITLMKKVSIKIDGLDKEYITSELTTCTLQEALVASDLSTVETNTSLKSTLSTKSKTAIKRVQQQAQKELKEVTKSHAKALQESSALIDQKKDKIAALKAQVIALLKLQTSRGASSVTAGKEGT